MANFKPKQAVVQHLMEGHPISTMESTIMFGLNNLSAEITRIKKDGYRLESQRVPMAKIIVRMNKYMVCVPPKELPQNEIFMMEYWIER